LCAVQGTSPDSLYLARNSSEKLAMPKRLLDRCQPDSIVEFRSSALQRFDDGLALAASERRAGAIYLWGYAAEMTLKAAYFSLIGLAQTYAITWQADIQPAIARGKFLGINWPNQGAGHNVRAWAELLVQERIATPGAAYPPLRRAEVESCGERIGDLWRETLRYHKNVAYEYEMRQVRQATEWLLSHSDEL
jgi:hypothetical protein